MIGTLRIEDTAFTYAAPEDALLRQAVILLIERLSGRRLLDRAYEEVKASLRPGDNVWEAGVRGLGLDVRFDAARLGAVPRTGPLVAVANHPFGVVDGLVLCYLVSLVRTDFKVVAIDALCRVPEVRPHVLPINFACTPEAAAESARSRLAARSLLAGGGCLVIFPAGGVSTARQPFGKAVDADWHPFTARLVAGAKAPVLPVYFPGQNGWAFHLVSRFSATLRLSLLMREALRRVGSTVEARVGEVLPFEALRDLTDPKAMVEHLRRATYAAA
jgi:putative hemolysin